MVPLTAIERIPLRNRNTKCAHVPIGSAFAAVNTLVPNANCGLSVANDRTNLLSALVSSGRSTVDCPSGRTENETVKSRVLIAFPIAGDVRNCALESNRHAPFTYVGQIVVHISELPLNDASRNVICDGVRTVSSNLTHN